MLVTDKTILDYIESVMGLSEYAGRGGLPAKRTITYWADLRLDPGGLWKGTVYLHGDCTGLTVALGALQVAGDSPCYLVRFSEPMPQRMKELVRFLVSESRGRVVFDGNQ